MNTMTTRGTPRIIHRYNHHADLGECSSVIRACAAAGLRQREMAHVLTCRGIRSPGGSPCWTSSMVARAVVALGLGRNGRAAN